MQTDRRFVAPPIKCTFLVPSTAAVAFQDRLFEGVIKGFESMKDMSRKPE